MFLIKTVLINVLVFIFVCGTFESETLTPKKRGSKKGSAEKTDKKLPYSQIKGPQKYSVFDKDFVSENIKTEDILTNHAAFFTETDEYNFSDLVLGYVTPWNNHGYDIAKIFGNKFSHISPVWLQIRRKGELKYEISGTHDVDKQWVLDVKNAGRERKTKVTPRVLFDGWTAEDFRAIFSNPNELNAMSEILLKSCKKYKFNGYVFEVWSQIAGGVPSDILIRFIQLLSHTFTRENFDFILVVPPKRGDRNLFTEDQFNELYDFVTAFSLMTYDYSNSQKSGGPNAPIQWVEEAIVSITTNITRRPKILMGLNFYGNDYTILNNNGGGAESIIGRDYIEKLEKYPDLPLIYNKEYAEHYFEYRDQNKMNHLIFYPTLFSIFKRIELAHNLNVGISIWEIGQGLDYFYDIL